jgi:hypothetical protein
MPDPVDITASHQESGAAVPTNAALSAAAASVRETRWAGGALALGASLFVLGVIAGLRAFEGDWDTSVGPSLPTTAALIHGKWATFRLIWLGEMFGALLIALAAFLLHRRPQQSVRWLPAGAAWIVVAIGSLIVAVSYTVTLGGYPPALAAFEEQPALFATLRGGVLFMLMIGSILQLVGLLAVLATEFRWKGRAIADRLVHVAVGVVVLGIAVSAGGIVAGEYGAAAIFFAGALLGAAIWTRGAHESAFKPRTGER